MTGKKVLIIRGGSMKGAFSVGAVETLYRSLGPDYFDAIYSNSVGIMQQVFYASKQIENNVKGWTDYVWGKQLIRFSNIFHNKPIINVDYLIELYKSDRCYLDLEAMKHAHAELYCVVTDHQDHKPVILDLKKEDVFKVMQATCAVPFLYHKKVYINGKRYHDGSLTIDSIFNDLIKKLLNDGFSEIVIILNHRDYFKHTDPRVHIIEPKAMPLWSGLDTNRNRILKTIEQGKKDALCFLEKRN